MIIWLASYPRSGNTLLRILLNRCFGVETYSLYDDRLGGDSDQVFADVVAHRMHGMGNAFRAQAEAARERIFVKTHELPDDDAKAIYVVRDGRASVVSYLHYRRDFAGENRSLAEVIRGEVWGGDWGSHVVEWALSGRPNTLLLRYEDITSAPDLAMQQVANFLDLPAPLPASLDFAELHAVLPQFFRSGSNAANVAELHGADLALFWEEHGDVMRALNYSDDRATAAGF